MLLDINEAVLHTCMIVFIAFFTSTRILITQDFLIQVIKLDLILKAIVLLTAVIFWCSCLLLVCNAENSRRTNRLSRKSLEDFKQHVWNLVPRSLLLFSSLLRVIWIFMCCFFLLFVVNYLDIYVLLSWISLRVSDN